MLESHLAGESAHWYFLSASSFVRSEMIVSPS